MRVLTIAPEPFFTPRGTPFSVYHRALIMGEKGAEIDLLTYGEGEDVAIPGVRILRIPDLPMFGPVRVGPSLLKAVLDVFLLFRTVALLLRNDYDVVHAHEEAAFFCALLKPVFRYRFIYDMHSSLPQQLLNFDFTRSRILIGLFQWLEDLTLRRSDVVITISPALAEHARIRMPDPSRHILIENSLVEEVTDPGPAPAGSAELRLAEDRPVVTYAGTFERYQGLDLLLQAFVRVLERRPDAFLLLVGGDAEQVERYRHLAREQGLDGDCLVHQRVPHAVARRLVSEAAVLVSPRCEGTNTPLKIYEQLASGRPLVATRILAHTQVLSDDVCFLVDPEPESIAEGILTALEDQRRTAEVVRAARELYRRSYSRQAYTRKVGQVLEKVRGDGGALVAASEERA